jgi:hypothetical protein
MGLALTALVPSCRPLAAFGALVLHGAILVVLAHAPAANVAVWPWNVALGLSGFVFLTPWKHSIRQTPASGLVRACLWLMLLAPAGFHVGVVDAYLSHNFYSATVPVASIAPSTMPLFRVPFPPEHRLFEQNFQLTCLNGDVIRIMDARWWFRVRGRDQRAVRCALPE